MPERKPHRDAWPVGTRVRYRSHPAKTTALTVQGIVSLRFLCECWPPKDRDLEVDRGKRGRGKRASLHRDDGSGRWDAGHVEARRRRML